MPRFSVSKRCFCAFCRSPRRVYGKKHVSIIDGALVFAASLLVSLILWQDFDPRAVVFFAVGLGLSEIFIIFRWRLSIACPHCGFDPVIYKKWPDRAAARVKVHMDLRRADPLSVFSPPPRLPNLIKKSDPDASKPARRPPGAGATR